MYGLPKSVEASLLAYRRLPRSGRLDAQAERFGQLDDALIADAAYVLFRTGSTPARGADSGLGKETIE